MPFVTDHTWTPSAYRRALSSWGANATALESDLLPRQAVPTGKPRHHSLSRRLRSLLTWRAMSRGEDWTALAANDNRESKTASPLLDSELEIRPRVTEIFTALKDVELREFRHARLGGGGRLELVPSGGDIERGRVYGQGRRRVGDCITRLGALRFSNGAAEQPALVLRMGKPVRGSVRVELGGLTGIAGHKVRDRFGKAKGAGTGTVQTVGVSLTAAAPAVDFVDPVADAMEAARVRQAVGVDVAAILDHALVAANFRDVGRKIGFSGKHAERKGIAALTNACAVLEAVLAA